MFKEIYFPVKYVLKNSKDTVKTKVLNVGLYDNSEFSPGTYIRQMTVLEPSGKKQRINENDIKFLEIRDLKKVRRRFVNSKSVLSKEAGLLQVMFNGNKAAWYRKSFYTGPIYTYETQNIDYLIIRKNKDLTEISFKAPGLKPLLKEKLGTSPDISALIDTMADENDLVNILKLYDKK
ncbi:hypothetical protein VUJ46_07825 [Chryseobacterium sp. MYb264]|uniref:hypothetical protein n=1 Tax=Chryseobacterium sp. MYb264 TaxID=2745153 RepID=UPI002E158667|nr:hypothetical protein VUJ46_07825 [Chryseobacterium sp. MYb264]